MATQVTLNSGSVDSAGSLLLKTNGTTTAVTIDTSQNVGVGVTPSAWDSTYKAIQVGARSMFFGIGSEANMANNAFYSAGYKYVATSAAGLYTIDANVHKWYNAASGTAGNAITFTQAMTLDVSGNLLVGKTSASAFTTVGTEINATGFVAITRSGSLSLLLNRETSNGEIAQFRRSNTTVGSIDVTTTATSYVTSSDYRLKNTIAPMTGALAKVALLKPCTYKWNADGSNGQGFIAHELAEVVPQCVTGAKDAVDAEGKPQYQGIDTSFLVATLTSAIQEQQALITQLTTRLTALENK
jgi:hypothetical protein